MGEREAYLKKVDAQLSEWQGWIEHYSKNPGRFAQQDQSIHQWFLERLVESYQAARRSLEYLGDSREPHWELAKQAVERSMIDLKRLLDESGAAHNAKRLPLQRSRKHVYEPFEWKGK